MYMLSPLSKSTPNGAINLASVAETLSAPSPPPATRTSLSARATDAPADISTTPTNAAISRMCSPRRLSRLCTVGYNCKYSDRAYSTRSCDMAKHWALASVVILGVLGTARAELPPLIPRDILFGNPEKASPQLSPDGKH